MTDFLDGEYTVTLGPDIRDYVGNAMNQDDDQVNGEESDSYTASVILRLPDLAVRDVTLSTDEIILGT
jgi:hypothetical protein